MLERKSERIESISPFGSGEMSLYDLSKTGMSCFHPEPKEKNSFVVVKINDLLLRAKVIYCQKREKDYRLGLQFWNILPERQVKLNDLVEKYSKGVPVTCKIIEDKDQDSKQDVRGTPRDTKRVITKNITKERKDE